MKTSDVQHSALFRIRGWVEYKLIDDATGEVLREGTSENVYTTWGIRSIFWASNFGSTITLSDDEKPSGIKDGLTTFHVDGKSPTPTQSPSPSYDKTNLIVSRTASYTSPSSPPRVVRKIVFGHGSATTGNAVHGATAYMEISPPISQNSGSTLELVYRQQFLVPTVKSMKRWQIQGLKNQRRAVQGFMFNSNMTSFYSGYNAWQNYGKYFFADEGARSGIAYTGGVGGNMPGNDSWAFRIGGSGSGNIQGNLGYYASRYSYTSFSTAYGPSSSMTGAFTLASAVYLGGTWNADDTFDGSSEFNATVGVVPLAAAEGDISTIFQHPPGEGYLFNVTGSVATGQGQFLVKGPYRPDDLMMPTNQGYRILFYDSGGTNGGTEGTYKVLRSGMNRFDGFLSESDNSVGMTMRQMYPTWDPTKDPDAVFTKNSCCYDGNGHYWATGRSTTGGRLFMWKGFTTEQVLDRVESDDTRFVTDTSPYMIGSGDDLVQIPWSNDAPNSYGQAKATPALTTDGAGLIYYPNRMTASGQQAVYVIDNTKPGRYYQRPSGVVTSGSNNFQVSASDEIHNMFPFITGSVGVTGIGAGDVGKKIRIVGATNAGNNGVRTITAFVDAHNVTVDGSAFTAESGLTWHWVTVQKRTSSNGITDRIRVLKYDKANSRLFAWTDSGIQVSTDNGYTWGSIIHNGTGLSTANAEKAVMPDGRHANSNCCIGNSGELYWVDIGDGSAVSSIGLNKYVLGAGPNFTGGTHTRILYSSFPNYQSTRALYCLNYDPVAPDLAGTQGALWMGTVYATAQFWRLTCDSFTSGGLVNFSGPIINQHLGSGGIANRLDQGVQTIDVGPGGLVSFNNMNNNNGYYNIGYDYSGYYSPPLAYYYMYSRAPAPDQSMGWGVCDIQLDGPAIGTMVHFSHPQHNTFATRTGFEYWWEPTSAKWIPWAGTEAQFNTRFGVSNGGRRKCHSTFETFRDNLRFKFLQNGSVAQTEEYKLNESFTFISSLGVHRTNIQDLFWYQDVTMASPVSFLEDQPIKTVPSNGGQGNVKFYWDRCQLGGFAVLDPQRPLGSGTNFLPEVVGNTGAKFGAIPMAYPYFLNGQYSGYVAAANSGQAGGPYPGNQSDAGWMMGLDLGVSQPVAKLRFSIKDNYWGRYGVYPEQNDIQNVGRVRIWYSDDNATWNEVTQVRWIARDTNSYDTGSSASIVAGGDASHPDITGLTGFTAGSGLLVVGQLITITGAANSANNGTFSITQVNSGSSVRIFNASAVTPDGNNGSISWVRNLDPGYKYVYIERSTNQVENNNGDSSPYIHMTFDLLGAGISSGNRTHRYWKAVSYSRYSENGNNISSREFQVSYFAAFGDDGYAVGIPSESAFPEANDVNIISTPVRQFVFIQDRVGLSGKGGINTVPDGFADGFTDTVTIASGTFNTGAISPTTDFLAYRHPTTGTFLRNDTGQVAKGHPASLGEQTQVKILSVTSSQIVVAKRNIPDNLSAADWEVRRPGIDDGDHAGAAGHFTGPFAGAGYMKFHAADAGREFRLVQRTVSYRP